MNRFVTGNKKRSGILAAAFLLAAFLTSALSVFGQDVIHYDGNGASSGKLNDQSLPAYAEGAVLKKNVTNEDEKETAFVHGTCSFIGWSLEAEGTSGTASIIPGGGEWKITDAAIYYDEDVPGYTFYAQWDCSVSKEAEVDPAEMAVAAKPAAVMPPGNADVPVLFRISGNGEDSADGQPRVLPETGFTGLNRVTRADKPASVRYIPTSMELQIPSLDVIMGIVSVEAEDGIYPVDWLEGDAGHLADTALPGEGISVIAAHNTLSAEEWGPFALLATLDLGDRIFVSTEDGRLMIFEVYENTKISDTDHETLAAVATEFDSTMTLMTCEDEQIEGGYASRRIISARQVL